MKTWTTISGIADANLRMTLQVSSNVRNNIPCLWAVHNVLLHSRCQTNSVNIKQLYLFYNNNTRLQIGPEVILLGGE